MSNHLSPGGLRVALVSGNYNYVRDGANQALNRLAGRLLARGAVVRVYSAVAGKPAFPPTGTLIPVPSFPIPFFGRGEYRMAMGLPKAERKDLAAFRPDIVHLSAPDWLGHAAKRWALANGVPVVASVHTRFETYGAYYGLGFARRFVERLIRKFYRGLNEIYVPSESMADLLRGEGYETDIRIWSRGVDRAVFRPDARSMEWRSSLGISGDEVVIGFVGRLVLEKGLDVVVDVANALRQDGVPCRFLIVGDGPARTWMEERLPDGIFVGFLGGEDLGRAYASFDVFLNPSITETFGNVTLEAMASALPVVAARATGSMSLVEDGETGALVPPADIPAFVSALEHYVRDSELRGRHGRRALEKSGSYDWDAINDSVIARYLTLAGV